jgi:hypothetical protein
MLAALALRLCAPAAPLIAPLAVAAATGWWVISAQRGGGDDAHGEGR